MPKWKFFQGTPETEEVKVNDNSLESFRDVTLADAELNMKKILKNVDFDEDLVKSAYADLAEDIEEIVEDHDYEQDSMIESCLLIQERYTAFIVDLIVNSKNYLEASEEVAEEAQSEVVVPKSSAIKVLDVFPKGKRKAFKNVDCYRTEEGGYIVLATAPEGIIFKNVERAMEVSDRDIAWYTVNAHKGAFNPETGKRDVTYHLGNKYSEF